MLILDSADSPNFTIALNFAAALRPTVFRRVDIIRVFAARGLRSLADLEILAAIAESVSAIAVITTFVKFAIASKLFCRAAWHFVEKLLARYGRQPEVHDWFIVLIRHLFVFIALAHALRKYRTRCLFICEILASLTHAGLPWLQQAIITAASGIGTRSVPQFFRMFFVVNPFVFDEHALRELDLFAGYQIHLKTFPFEENSNMLLVPPAREAIGPMPRITSHGKIRFAKSGGQLTIGPKTIIKRRLGKERKKPADLSVIKKPEQPARNRPVTAAVPQRLSESRRASLK
jgi:hypothetical protein